MLFRVSLFVLLLGSACAIATSTNRTRSPAFYIHNETGMVIEIVGATSGFQFGYTKPQNPGYFQYGSVHGAISTKLSHLGLACSQNTPTKVGQYTNQVVGKYLTGPFEWLTNKQAMVSGNGAVSALQGPAASPGWPSSTNQVNGGVGGALHDKMIIMLRNLQKLQSIYYVSHTKSSGSYSSTSLGSILETFRQAGNFVGQLQSGQQVQAGQVGNLVANMLQSLTETTKSDWSYSKKDVLCAILPSTSGANMFAGVFYSYTASVHDFKNKKKKTHKSNYAVDNWSVVFSDQSTFDYVYKKVIGA